MHMTFEDDLFTLLRQNQIDKGTTKRLFIFLKTSPLIYNKKGDTKRKQVYSLITLTKDTVLQQIWRDNSILFSKKNKDALLERKGKRARESVKKGKSIFFALKF